MTLDIKVGTKVCIVEDGVNSGRHKAEDGYPDRFESEITKVGRKYFYTENKYKWGEDLKFNIDNLSQFNGGYATDYSIHESWEAYKQKLDLDKAWRELMTKYFDVCRGSMPDTMTIDKINQIIDILEDKE